LIFKDRDRDNCAFDNLELIPNSESAHRMTRMRAYQPQSFTGGFEETRLDANSFRVSFKGNGYTSTNRAEEMTLLRSAELCLEGGFRHFVIVEGRTDVRQEGYTTPVQVGYTRRGAYVYGGNSYNVSKPSSNNTIMCLDAKPEGVFSYDARTLYLNMAGKYQVPPNPRIAEAQRRANEDREVRLSAAETAPLPAAPVAASPSLRPQPVRSQSSAPTPRKTGKDTYQAELLAKNQSCAVQPQATLSAQGGGFETYSVPCSNGDTIAIRCEFGNCRVLQ